MEYMTSKEAAALWGIGKCRVDRLIREGRIEGAVLFGKSWMIPKGALKPADGRTRQSKSAVRADPFRFPLFANAPAGSFVPALSKEEALLRTAQIDFFACRFDSARQVFSDLAERAINPYVRLCAVAFMAVLSSCHDMKIDWRQYYHRLNIALLEEFPHREEMKVLLPWVDYFCGLYASVSGAVSFDPEYDYPPSVDALNAFLSIFSLYSNIISGDHSPLNLTRYEILCRTLERGGHFIEAQELHRILFISRYMSHEESLMLFHLRQVMRIATERGLLFDAADLSFYYPDAFQKIIKEYPADFIDRLSEHSKKISRNYAEFMKEYKLTNLYSSLSDSDYQLMLYAFQRYTNKQIADALNLSVHAVANRLSGIYDKLNIRTKKELIALIHTSISV